MIVQTVLCLLAAATGAGAKSAGTGRVRKWWLRKRDGFHICGNGLDGCDGLHPCSSL